MGLEHRVGELHHNVELAGLRRELDALAAQRLRALVGQAPIVVFGIDRDGHFTLSEGRGLDALGLKPGEVVGQSVYDVYREVPRIIDNVRRCLAGESVSDTVRVGDLVFESIYSPRRDEHGFVSGVSGVAWDVTQRVRAEEETLAARQAEIEAEEARLQQESRRLASERAGLEGERAAQAAANAASLARAKELAAAEDALAERETVLVASQKTVESERKKAVTALAEVNAHEQAIAAREKQIAEQALATASA